MATEAFGVAAQMVDDITGPSRRIRRELSALQSQLQDLTKLGDPLERVSAGLTALGRSAMEASRFGADLVREFGAARSVLQESAKAAAEIAKALQSVAKGATAVKDPITSLKAKLEGFVSSVGGKLSDLGHGMADVFKDMVKEGAKFDQQIVFAGTTMNATAAEFKVIEAEAKRLGATTAFTAYEAAQGFVGLGQAGFDAAQSVKLMQPILHLAGGQMVSIEKATGLVSQGLKTFGLDAGQAARVADVFSRAANASYQTVADLGHAFKYVGPVANALGKSIEETAGALSVSADAALRGAMGGTGLRRILTKLITPSKQLDDALRGLGLKMADIDPRSQSISDVMEKLAPLADRTGAAMKLFGDRGGPAFLAMARAQGEVNGEMLKGAAYMRAMTAKMTEGNSAAKIYETMMDTVQGKIKIFHSAVEAVKLAVFGGMKDPLKSTISKAAIWIEDLAAVITRLSPVITVLAQGVVEGVTRLFSPFTNFMETSGISDAFNLLKQSGPETNAVLDQVVGGWVEKVRKWKDDALVQFDQFVQRAKDMSLGLATGLKEGFAPLLFVLDLTWKAVSLLTTHLIGASDAKDKARSSAQQLGQEIGVAAAIIGTLMGLKFAAWLVGATVATKGLTAAMLLNPATWIIAALVGVIEVLDRLSQKLQSVNRAWKFFAQGPGGMMLERIELEKKQAGAGGGPWSVLAPPGVDTNRPATPEIAAAKLAAKGYGAVPGKQMFDIPKGTSEKLLGARIDAVNELTQQVLGAGSAKERAEYAKKLEGVMQRGGAELGQAVGTDSAMGPAVQRALELGRAAEKQAALDDLTKKPDGKLSPLDFDKPSKAGKGGGGRGRGLGSGFPGGAGRGGANRDYQGEIRNLMSQAETAKAWGEDPKQIYNQLQQVQVDRQLAEGKRRKKIAGAWEMDPEVIGPGGAARGGRSGGGRIGGLGSDGRTATLAEGDAAIKAAQGQAGVAPVIMHVAPGAIQIKTDKLDAEEFAEKVWPVFKRKLEEMPRREGAG